MEHSDRAEPSWPRVVAAFAIAPTVPVVLVLAVYLGAAIPAGLQAATTMLLFVFFYAGLVAYLPALLVGVPLYIALRSRIRLSPLSGAIAGSVVALIGPTIFAVVPAIFQGGGSLGALGLAWIVFAALGAIAGWTLWAVLTAR